MAYKGHALKLGATWIGGIDSQSFTNDPQMQTNPVAGSPYPQQTSITEIKTGFKFDSFNVASALSVLGFIGLSLGGGVSAELYEILYNDDGSIASGSAHRKVVFANGRAIWRQIVCPHRQDAKISIEVFGLSSNGLASPVAYTEGIALPANVDSARHTMLSVQLANINLGCVQNLTIDSGMKIESAGCSSNVFDTRMDLKDIVPKIRVVTLNSALVGSGAGKVDLTGAIATHANTIIRLRKKIAKTATFVADATAEHITITADGMVMPTKPFESQRNEDGTSEFELTGTHDGTNLPFVINPAAALA